ncbi:MAG: transposase [Gracilimonas sp.]|nr:transposase [Gracilimonas sp.]
MGRSRYKILDDRYPYFITSSIVEHYNILKFPNFRDIIINGLNFLTKERDIEINAYVIMHDHFHLIAKGEDLGIHMARFKSYTARRILDALDERHLKEWLEKFRAAKRSHKKDREHQLWMEGIHPKQIMSHKMMEQKINYIHHNPVKAGLVEKGSDWKFSSWGDYNGDSTGLVEVTIFCG